MIRHVVNLTVPGATAKQFYEFETNPNDEQYQAWWPGEHLQFHITKRGDKKHIGDEVFFDEYLGKGRRLKFRAIVVVAEYPNKIVWQMKAAGLRLPAFLELSFQDSPDGLLLCHELRIGFDGIGKIIDPFIRVYFTKSFQTALEEHCHVEWPMLAEYLKTEESLA